MTEKLPKVEKSFNADGTYTLSLTAPIEIVKHVIDLTNTTPGMCEQTNMVQFGLALIIEDYLKGGKSSTELIRRVGWMLDAVNSFTKEHNHSLFQQEIEKLIKTPNEKH